MSEVGILMSTLPPIHCPLTRGSRIADGTFGRSQGLPTLRERDIPTTLRRMTTEDVAAWCESFEQGSANNVLGHLELQRRRDQGLRVRIWIATGIALVALVLAATALYFTMR